MGFIHVSGKNVADLKLYTLSTCGWCKKVKAYLEANGIGYSFVDVDLLYGDERINTLDTVKAFNPRCSFPTLVVNGGESVIIGYDEGKLGKLLG